MDWYRRVILAPLTKGGNLPFRRVCLDFGAEVTTSEMAYARQVNRRSRAELALLRKHPSENCFGVQLAAGKPEEAVQAGMRSVEAGAAFVDLNAGCPIHDVVRRGMGAALLKRASFLARIIEAMVRELPVPVTVKIRSGWKEEKVIAPEVARLAEEAGAAAISIHPRSRNQRYAKAADWDLVGRLVEERSVPIIGNGDILTYFESHRLQEQSGCASVMLARGALIKPWLFQEIESSRAWEPTAPERVAVYRRLANYMKEHFRDDDMGRQRAMRFLPWHLGFFWRYRPLPEAEYGELSLQHPLLQTRQSREEGLDTLEQVLRDPREDVHEKIANVLWDAESDEDAVAKCEALELESQPSVFEGGEIATSHG